MSETSRGFVRVIKVLLLLRGWLLAIVLLVIGIKYAWLGHLAGRLIGIALIVGFLLVVRGLTGIHWPRHSD